MVIEANVGRWGETTIASVRLCPDDVQRSTKEWSDILDRTEEFLKHELFADRVFAKSEARLLQHAPADEQGQSDDGGESP